MQYQQYLRSEHWRLLRGAKLQIAPRCEKCRSKEEIEVHHKIYRTSWHDSKLQDLQTLCHGCHMMEHAKEWERLAHYLQPSPPPKHVSDYKETVSRRPEAKQHPKLPIPKRPKNHPVWKGPYEMRPATMNKLRQQAGMKLPVAVNGVYTFHPI